MKYLLTILSLLILNIGFSQAPPGSTLLFNFNMADANGLAAINGEPDSTTYYPLTNTSYGQFTDATNAKWYLYRNYSGGLKIFNGELWSTIKDGAPNNGDGYGRSEISLADGDFIFDTTKIYTLQWTGYFPNETNYLTSWYTILVAMQIHSLTQTPTVWGLNLGSDNSIFSGDVYNDGTSTDYGNGPGLLTVNDTIGTFTNWFTPHTIRVTLKEGKGYTGQDAFFHIQVDGHTVYYRNTGQVGSDTFDDYVKFGGLYDWNNAMCDINNTTRGRRFSLITDSYAVYQVSSDLADTPGPTISMSGDQVINTTSTSVTAVGTPASGESITSYSWTKLSGTGTITSPSSSTTGLTSLAGTSQYQCVVTQTDGQTATGTVSVTVNNPPTANAGSDQTITLPTNSVNLSGSGTDTDGTISSYSWTKISGGSYTISNSGIANPVLTNLVQGTYVFQLTVTDNNGATGTDTVQITVNGAVNTGITNSHIGLKKNHVNIH